MSLAPCHPALRARVSEAIAEVLVAAKSHRALGSELGHAGHTITARGSDLSRWTLLDALLLAAGHDDLRRALLVCLQGDAPLAGGDAASAFGELLQLLQRDASAHGDFVQMLRDGALSPAEAKQAKQTIIDRRTAEDRALLPALDARIGRSK